MGNTMPEGAGRRHLAMRETKPRMLKVDLPKGENALWKRLGIAVDICRWRARLTLKEFAGKLGANGKDEKQVGRWIRGEERPQIEVVLDVPELEGHMLLALAEVSAAVAVHESIGLRRTA